MIRIANWLLTRRCNLKCDYCAIVRDVANPDYKPISYFHSNEMSTQLVIETLEALKRHNPEMFHIFYGGEPFLRKDLADIVNFCNENEIEYTIITNNTKEIQPMIKKFFQKVDFVKGMTSSVDPVFDEDPYSEDRVRKSVEAILRLRELREKGLVQDVVAEITVLRNTQKKLIDVVSELSKYDICSSITFVDLKKNAYYDFSNVTDPELLVYKTPELSKVICEILDDDSLYVHMKKTLLSLTFSILPSNHDCHIEDNLHNITIDSDGSLRLCLRIRGMKCPSILVKDIFQEDSGDISEEVMGFVRSDKTNYCELCNHTCLIMSKLVDSVSSAVDELIHSDRRKGGKRNG